LPHIGQKYIEKDYPENVNSVFYLRFALRDCTLHHRSLPETISCNNLLYHYLSIL
jgi:hypothetical protein